jgi:hypothetical protein
VVFDCLEITTGFIHEFFSRMLPGVGLSMRETAMASNPLKLLPGYRQNCRCCTDRTGSVAVSDYAGGV